MNYFFANFNVVIAAPEEFKNPRHDIQATEDSLGVYLLKVNREGSYFRDIFGEQQEFSKHERQQIKLFAIGVFLKRDRLAREKLLPGVEADSRGVF